MPTLKDVKEELAAKTDALAAIIAEGGGWEELDLARITALDGDNDRKMALIRQKHDELGRLKADEERLSYLAEISRQTEAEQVRLNHPSGALAFPQNGHASALSSAPPPRPLAPGFLAQALREHPGLKAFRAGNAPNVVMEFPNLSLKTLITLTTIAPQNVRQPDVVPMALEDRTIADLMLESPVDRGTVEYYEETTVTNAAAPVAETGTKPESTLAWTLRTETVRKIATNIPATKEALDDNSFLEGQIRGRLAFMVKRTEEDQLLNGSGTAPAIRGLLNRVGIQTQARGTESNMDAVLRAMQLIRGSAGAGFAEPTAIVMHPTNWTTIKLAKTADGIYLWGSPATEGPERLWGLPVRQTTAIAANTALVGAFRPWAEVLRREGITVTMSTEHSTFFVENKVLIQAEERLALAVYRPTAFATCTGLN